MSDLYEENNESAQNQSQTDGASVQDGTEDAKENKEPVTYSWVSPKLRGGQTADEEDQTARDPWSQENPNVWRSENTESTASNEAGQTEQADFSEDKTIFDTVDADDSNKKKRRRKKKKVSSGNRKPAGPGRKWAVTVALAVVFGLVAGLVFTGVSAVGRKVTAGSSKEKTEVASTEPAGSDGSAQQEGKVQVSSSDSSSSSSQEGGTVADVAAQCMPSLVTISTISVEEMQSFFGQTQQYEVEGAGTGVIVGQNDTEILIATNNHVVSGAESLSVGFTDETAVSGAVKGYDADTDLAVVSVNLEDIPDDTMNQIRVCEMGDSDELVLGEQVVAIGNALGYGQSVTSGYISAFNRELELSDGDYTFTSTGLLQTDASINAGNSGGALLNMKGQLIGINEAKSSSSSSSASVDNIGFAIPISKAEPILENLMTLTTRSKVSDDEAAYIGITCADVSQETAEMYSMPTGVCLTSIIEDGPAEQAGLKKGDILTSFDGRDVSSYSELIDLLQYYAAGETVEVVVQRSDDGEYKEKTVSLTLGSADDMPDDYQSENSSQDSQSDESQQNSQNGQNGQEQQDSQNGGNQQSPFGNSWGQP